MIYEKDMQNVQDNNKDYDKNNRRNKTLF